MRKLFYFGVFFVTLPLIIGAISGYFTSSGISSWYIGLNKPPLNPPNWIFGPVWTILYLMMGFSSFLIWKKQYSLIHFLKKRIRKLALRLYFIQLFFNFIWSFLFFYFQSPLYALINIVILWFLIFFTILNFYKLNKKASFLLVPYILWVSFASYLNLMFFILN